MALWYSAVLESSGSINVGGHVTDSGDSNSQVSCDIIVLDETAYKNGIRYRYFMI